MPPLVSVVIVTWNGLRFLPECWAALRAQTYAPIEVIVVDNGSTDGSGQWLAVQTPAPRVIVNAGNRGFAAANNQGLAAARGEYVALLNNDAYPEPGWLAALVAAAEADPGVGLLGGLLLFADRPHIVQSAGICVDRCGITWDAAGGELAAQQGDQPRPSFGPSAGAALYRRELLAALGGFDEAFFAYLEDVDLAWRARRAGWRAVLVPSARVKHVHSGTGRQGSALKTFYLARNKYRLLVKNYPWPYWVLSAPLIGLYDLLSLADSLLNQRTLAGLRGRLAGLRGLGAALRARRAAQAAAHTSGWAVLRLLAPAAAPWRVRRRYAHLERRADG
ncbi:MAG: glycosyltransferase family 2 protein [Anaerolineales bacterium]|nr:glycosyltransferase family 2 protein [Anaerolineales bacterium]